MSGSGPWQRAAGDEETTDFELDLKVDRRLERQRSRIAAGVIAERQCKQRVARLLAARREVSAQGYVTLPFGLVVLWGIATAAMALALWFQ